VVAEVVGEGASAAEAVAEVSAAVEGVTAVDHQVVVLQEAAVLGASGTQAAGRRLHEATAVVAAVAVLTAEKVQEPGTGAVFRSREAGVRRHAEDGRILVEIHEAGVRKHGQSDGIHAQMISTSVAMI
jgi:hypothetical protein